MDVVLLGTGSPLPDPNRAGPATLVRAAGRNFLFDCGRAVVMRLAGAFTPLPMVERLLLTHLHSDHAWALNDLLTSRWVSQMADAPLPITGPVGTRHFVERTLASMDLDVGYRLSHHDDLNWEPSTVVQEVGDGVVFDDGTVRITSALTDHGVVKPAIGYRIEAEGKVVVIGGDTVPCEGLRTLCQGADVYVQTVLRPSLVKLVPMQRFQDILDYHSTVEDAGNTAAAAGVKTLVLTHMVPPVAPGTEQEWIDEAAAVFGGTVVLGQDLLTITA